MRPSSIAEVARLTEKGESFDLCLRNFLDEFKEGPMIAALEEEPKRLRGVVEKGDVYDAYLAAVTESLTEEHKLPVPPWVWAEDRKLRRPWFALPWDGMRAILLLESPSPFARVISLSARML